jgi:hypothetical protein
MAGPVQTLASGVLDPGGIPAVAKISPNVRVSATTGPIGTIADVLTFVPSPLTFPLVGNWLVPNNRTLVGGLPSISVSSVGIVYNVIGVPYGPPVVASPDSRVMAQ